MVTVQLDLTPEQEVRLDLAAHEMGFDRGRYIKAVLLWQWAQDDAPGGRSMPPPDHPDA